jgi:hypothetical protein
MPDKPREYYLSLRSKFAPSRVRLVIVAESPPAKTKKGQYPYFYDPAGKETEWLFAALMERIGVKPKTKEEGLRAFQMRGWVLVDATYTPVNKPRGDRDRKKGRTARRGLSQRRRRNEVIEDDYPKLVGDLKGMLPDLSTPIILVKVNVCELLEAKLTADGFNVLNRGKRVYFPSHSRQPKFHRQFRAIVAEANI